MDRRSELRRTGPPPRRTGLASVTPLPRATKLDPGRPLRPVSSKQRRMQRVRKREVLAYFGPDPLCEFPGCQAYADDAHERKTRARGGDPTDVRVISPLCRHHHDWCHANSLEAERLGFLLPSWAPDPDDGGAA